MSSGLETRKYVMQCDYDFATDGGAVGTVTLRGDRLPSGAVVNVSAIQIKTQFTSDGSATLALELVGTADVLAATAVASLTAGNMVGKPVPQTASTWITTTAATQLVATIATAAMTAGKMTVMLEYFIP